jgi:surfeit locus 1 family protein
MKRNAGFWWVTLAAILLALATARLGWWQLDRAAQKIALQRGLEKQAAAAPIERVADLPDDPTAAAGLHQRRARLTGRWSATHTVYLDNRQMDGRPGFFVLTPLRLSDGRALLVQRGWLARDFAERTRVAEVPTADGEVAVSGRLAPPPARLFQFEGGEAGRIRQNLDLAAFARETGLALLSLSLLQTEPVDPPDGLRREWPAPALGVDKHYGYAAQWFALSTLVVILYVWFQFIQPRRTRRR